MMGAVKPGGGSSGNTGGLTLIEVLLAVTILSLGLVVMLAAISRCLGVLKVSTRYHDVMWALSAGEAEYPLVVTDRRGAEPEDPEDLGVSTEEFGGILYERTVDDPYEDEDDSDVRLLIVRTRLAWADRGRENSDEIVRYWLYREK